MEQKLKDLLKKQPVQKTLYEQAVEKGYTGTKEEFYAKLPKLSDIKAKLASLKEKRLEGRE